MEKLQWMFELLDRMSGPANKIASSLGKLDPALKTSAQGSSLFARGIGLIGRTFGPQASGAVLRFASAAVNLAGRLKFLKPVVDAVGGVAGKGLSLLGKGALVGAAGIAAAALAVTTAIVGFGVSGVKIGVEMAMFKEDSIAAFKAMSGSQDAAERIFAKAAKFAGKTPFKTSEVIGMAQSLLSRGFKEDELDNLMLGVGDVGAMLGTEKMASVINALGKMRSNGKMTGETLEMLADAGINSQLVFESLGKQLGKSREEVQALMSAGKITDAQGIQAAMDAIANGISGGKLGGAMDEKSRTLSGLISTLQSVPEDLMAKVDTSGFLEPVKQFIKTLSDTLGPDTAIGKRLIGLFTLVGDSIGRLAGRLNAGNVEGGINGILNVLEPLVKALLAFGTGVFSGIGKVFGPLLDALEKMGQDPEMLQQMTKGMMMFGEALGGIVAILAIVIAALPALGLAMWTAIASINDGLNGWWDSIKAWWDGIDWAQLGIDIVLGILGGMMGMSPAVFEGVKSLADGLIGTAKSALGINSPSTVGAEIGNFFGLGILQGLGGSGAAQALANPIGAMASSAFGGGGAAAVPAPAAAGAAGGSFSFGNVIVQIDGTGKDGETVGKEVASSLKAKVAAELSSLGLGFGG